MTTILPAAAKATNILILDIERLPGLAEIWDQKTRFVHVSKFKRMPRTICFAAQRYGQREIEFVAEWDQGHSEMIRRSWELYDAADIVVTYNGISFDTPNLRTDWHRLGLGEPRPFKGGRPVPGQPGSVRPRELQPAAPARAAGAPRQVRALRLGDGRARGQRFGEGPARPGPVQSWRRTRYQVGLRRAAWLDAQPPVHGACRRAQLQPVQQHRPGPGGGVHRSGAGISGLPLSPLWRQRQGPQELRPCRLHRRRPLIDTSTPSRKKARP